jgi:hypothetical protein
VYADCGQLEVRFKSEQVGVPDTLRKSMNTSEANSDGMLLANSLHFVRDAAAVLARLAARVRPGGRVVLVEYDKRRASPWIPYPIPPRGSRRWPRPLGVHHP